MTTAPQSAPQPEPLWQPDPDRIAGAQVTRFQAWAAEHHGAPAPTPATPPRATRRCTAGPSTNWTPSGRPSPSGSTSASPPRTRRVLADRAMPGAQLVPRRHPQLRRARPARRRGPGPRRRPRPPARRRDPRAHAPSPGPSCAARSARWPPNCARLGVRPGDRVSGYLPNIPQAVVALLATAAVGARLDLLRPRLRRPQRPRPLPAGRTRRPVHRRRLPLRRQGARPPRDRRRTARANCPPCAPSSTSRCSAPPPPKAPWTGRPSPPRDTEPVFEQVPFDHPLWVLYSSGTTGLPKAIVQSQGGILARTPQAARPALRPRPRATASSGTPPPAG